MQKKIVLGQEYRYCLRLITSSNDNNCQRIETIMFKGFFKNGFLVCAGILMFAPYAHAQNDTLLPKLPDPLQNLANDGAQIRFLGKDQGVDGWIAIKNGQEQYFYVLPNGAFLSGILFDAKGKTVTINQVKQLRKQSGALLDTLAADIPPPTNVQDAKEAQKYEFKTPSEQLFYDIETSNWVPIGRAGTPVFYSFIDPQCPHCHAMMEKMKPYIDNNKVQVRMIPVGFKDETRAQAAFLMATPSPETVWWRHMEGSSQLPASQEISQQGVQRNLSIMQSWKLSVTPLLIYRGKDEKVKIIRGAPKDIDALIADLGART